MRFWDALALTLAMAAFAALLALAGCGPDAPAWDKRDTGRGQVWVGKQTRVDAECRSRGALTGSDGCVDPLVGEALVPAESPAEVHRVLIAFHEACHLFLRAGHDVCPWPMPKIP